MFIKIDETPIECIGQSLQEQQGKMLLPELSPESVTDNPDKSGTLLFCFLFLNPNFFFGLTLSNSS